MHVEHRTLRYKDSLFKSFVTPVQNMEPLSDHKDRDLAKKLEDSRYHYPKLLLPLT